jgi:hypothetical protein
MAAIHSDDQQHQKQPPQSITTETEPVFRKEHAPQQDSVSAG